MNREKLLENQRKHQRRIIFDEWGDNAPFQWNGNVENVIYYEIRNPYGQI